MRLTLRNCWPEPRDDKPDYRIFLEGYPIGRMYEYGGGTPAGRWFWAVGSRIPQEPWMRGLAGSFEEAKANVRAATEKLVGVYGLPSASRPEPF